MNDNLSDIKLNLCALVMRNFWEGLSTFDVFPIDFDDCLRFLKILLLSLSELGVRIQVEHVSKLLRDMGNNLDEINPGIRLEVINMTKNLDKRLENLYHLIENDILSKLMFSPNDISFYKVCFLAMVSLLSFKFLSHSTYQNYFIHKQAKAFFFLQAKWWKVY